MIYTHDEVELIDVLTLMEAVSKKAGSKITARMVADCHLAIKWFHELADFSGTGEGQIKVRYDGGTLPWPKVSDWNWDGPVVMQSLGSTGIGSLAFKIYMSSAGIGKKTVVDWITSHANWKVKSDE